MADYSKRIAQYTSLAFLALAGVTSLVRVLYPQPSSEPLLPAQLDVASLHNVEVLAAIPSEKFLSSDPTAIDEASVEIVEQIKASWPDDHRREFLIAIAPHALATAVDKCVPPSITLAQAVLESGWGRSGLAAKHNNLFGMKSGASANGVALDTREVEQGQAVQRKARFRTFQDWGQSIKAHGSLLQDDPRYEQARMKWEHWPLFLETLAPIYATDPSYVNHISSLVETYHLDKWDQLVTDAAARRSNCPQWNHPENQGISDDARLISIQ